MVLLKILAIYYPDKFVSVAQPETLITCARDLGIKKIPLDSENTIEINNACKKIFSIISSFENWSDYKLGGFIMEAYQAEGTRRYFIVGSKYGEDSRDVFPEMFDQSVISIGFATHLNLGNFNSKSAVEIKNLLDNETQSSTSAIKQFLSIKKGDWIAVKKSGSPKGSTGFLSIIALAEVVEKSGEIYQYDPNGLGHTLHVKFLRPPFYKEFNIGGFGRTLKWTPLSRPRNVKVKEFFGLHHA